MLLKLISAPVIHTSLVVTLNVYLKLFGTNSVLINLSYFLFINPSTSRNVELKVKVN